MSNNTKRECAREVLRLESQGKIRTVGVQLFWLCELADVSLPLVSRYVGCADSTIYRIVQGECSPRADLYQKIESLVKMMAMAIGTEELPHMNSDSKLVRLEGEEGLAVFQQIVAPFLSTIHQPVYAEEHIPDYLERYTAVRKKIVKRLREADAQADCTDGPERTYPPEAHQPAH